MTVEELIREVSNADFHNDVVIITEDSVRIEDFEVYVDNDEVYIEIRRKR